MTPHLTLWGEIKALSWGQVSHHVKSEIGYALEARGPGGARAEQACQGGHAGWLMLTC